jgi:SAM-dependent methyltransferase
MSGLYVQYGCGLSAPEGWSNFDASPTLRFERLPVIGRLFTKNAHRFPENVRYGDIVKGLPLADGTVDAVYASHILEHLARDDFHAALHNTWRLLKDGGVFRLIVPDLQWRAEVYVRASAAGDSKAGSAFLRSCCLGIETRPRSLWELMTFTFGHSKHFWMYDEPAMREALQAAGFRNIRRVEIGDAANPMFAKVEEEGRFFDSGHPELAMEAIRPSVVSGNSDEP